MKNIFGKGVNDLKNQSTTPIYKTWARMLERCYSDAFQERKPSYIGCSVCEDWLTFSKFKAWMETQDWEGKQLDKDLLIRGNKVYSPQTCVFIPQELNNFLKERKNDRGEYPIGVSFDKINKRFKSQVCINGKKVTLGYFDKSEDAHKRWLSKKDELALEFVKEQIDERIAMALFKRYKEWDD